MLTEKDMQVLQFVGVADVSVGSHDNRAGHGAFRHAGDQKIIGADEDRSFHFAELHTRQAQRAAAERIVSWNVFHRRPSAHGRRGTPRARFSSPGTFGRGARLPNTFSFQSRLEAGAIMTDVQRGCARGGMADTPDLGSGPERGGGSSPLARTIPPV